ncbi:glutathione S-transferase [Endogone sp. FLAS-F59071]|nr:glutathione S-transferase [Endogone sp. FLAS-F59071]|eukprot:RUS19879.1 glutathione S-transferase [Endogone sp. FLAS-F59071]
MLTLYEFSKSGNCYKIRLLLNQLQLPYVRVEKNILKGETRTPEFLSLNPNGRLPVVQIESGDVLVESNSILFYFAEGTNYLPEDQLGRQQVLQWMFFEQYNLEPNVGSVRFWFMQDKTEDDPEWPNIKKKKEKGYEALHVMEKHLGGVQEKYFVQNRYTIADIALYAYAHVATEGGFELLNFPNIQQWLKNVESQPNYLLISA